ncbi:MAG: hypothetical protein ACI9JL_004567 [Paracoccaceae bacterium]
MHVEGGLELANDRIDEKQVDTDLGQIGKIREIAWQRNPQTLLAIIERMQVNLVLEDMPRRRRQMHRAIIDYFEDVLEERIERDANTDREQVRGEGSSYLRGFLKSLND